MLVLLQADLIVIENIMDCRDVENTGVNNV